MQLRVPKRYQPRRRRRLLPGRSFFMLLITAGLGALGYAVLQNPEPFRVGASDVAGMVREQVDSAQDRMFPVMPTATPDVRTDLVECENANLLGNIEQILESCRRVLPGLPNDANVYYRVAYNLVITSSGGENTARINEALAIADQGIRANPESPLGWSVKAMALDWSRRHTEALVYARRALDLDPNSTITKAHLANIYRNLGQGDLARQTINEAILELETRGGNDETRAQVYRNYGRYLTSEARFTEAVEPYQTARRAMPSHVYIAIELADVYTVLGRNDPTYSQLANQILQETQSIAPRDVYVLFRLGEYHRGRGEPVEAKEFFSRCVTADPVNLLCHSRLGWLYYLSDSLYLQAIDHLKIATEQGSTQPYDWYLLGRAYFRLNQCDLAAAPLRRGYELLQNNTVFQVTLSDFDNAFRECNISR